MKFISGLAKSIFVSHYYTNVLACLKVTKNEKYVDNLMNNILF